MSSESVLVRQQEKPQHYNYLKSFRVDQCKAFLSHQCNKHKPFTCFNWHFPNQKRRKPILNSKTGRFNYSPDQYCPYYDDNSGTCPNKDNCPYLHRNLGDSERRYHLKNYKVEPCSGKMVHGMCDKNGVHCAFAHGSDDLRQPVLDISDQRTKSATFNSGSDSGLEANSLDFIDSAWSNVDYLLENYKTEMCTNQSSQHDQSLCPRYHSTKERRRKKKQTKYRAVICPLVREKDEWIEPENCEQGDECVYCHTRMEMQFHPDVFRSRPCTREQGQGTCNKFIFCPFAHNFSSFSSSNFSYNENENSNSMPQGPFFSEGLSINSINPITYDELEVIDEPQQNHASTSSSSNKTSNFKGQVTKGDSETKVSELSQFLNENMVVDSRASSNQIPYQFPDIVKSSEYGVEPPHPPGFNRKNDSDALEIGKLRTEVLDLRNQLANEVKLKKQAIQEKEEIQSQMNSIRTNIGSDNSKYLRCLHDNLNLKEISFPNLFFIHAKLNHDVQIVNRHMDEIVGQSEEDKCSHCHIHPKSYSPPCGHGKICQECLIIEPLCSSCMAPLPVASIQ